MSVWAVKPKKNIAERIQNSSSMLELEFPVITQGHSKSVS